MAALGAASKGKESLSFPILDLPDGVFSSMMRFLGIPEFLACLRVSHEFSRRALALLDAPSSPWLRVAEILEGSNAFDVCHFCGIKIVFIF